MNKTDAQGEIRYIKEMIDQTRKITAGSWMFFLIWGVMVILGVAGMYALAGLGKFHLIWINWVIFMLAGVLFTIIYARRFEHRTGAKTYSQIATGHLSIACGAGFFLVGFIFPLFKLYTWELIPILIALIAGSYTFTLGGIFEWNLLKWCGLLWWLGSVGMVFIKEDARGLLFIPLILIGYITPALVLRSSYRKQRDKNAD
ncbi:MAG: hypothetical protein MUP70_07585 [Candidatus Aminicenantes bacterium]|nr:hypothetical protein [Candidatus Aminicenantes bacterium]